MSDEYAFGIRNGLVTAHSIKRMPRDGCRGIGLNIGMVGILWKPNPRNDDIRVPKGIGEEEELEDHAYVPQEAAIDDEEPDGAAFEVKEARQHRVMHVTKEGSATHGASHTCNGCNATLDGWKRQVAHSAQFRESMMGQPIKDGDPDGRTHVAHTRQTILELADAGDELDAKLQILIQECQGEVGRGKGTK